MKKLLVLCAMAAMVAPAWAATPPAERAGDPGVSRLNDQELQAFLEAYGDDYPPGTPLPHWAPLVLAHRGAASIAVPPPSIELAGPGDNVDVSREPALIQSESFVAVNPADPLRLVAAANNVIINPLALFWSSDGGASWGRTTMPLAGASFHADPGVAWDSQGTAYASALGAVYHSVRVVVTKSFDGGQTWQAPATINSNLGNDKPLMTVNHQLGTSCQDYACIAWNQTNASQSYLYSACAPRAKPPWTIRSLVRRTGLIGASPAFGPDGEIYVAWANYGSTPTRLEMSRSTDCGRTFKKPWTFAQTRGRFDLGIPAMCGRRALIYPALDVDRSSGPQRGTLYAAWTDAAPGAKCPATQCAASCTSNVYVAHSGNGGLSWSTPKTVHADVAGSDQFNPWLAVDEADGGVSVMWYDTRQDSSRQRTDVYYRHSGDGGVTWGDEEVVTTAMSDETTGGAEQGAQEGDYNGLAIYNCHAYPFWTDRRDGGKEQIYTADAGCEPGFRGQDVAEASEEDSP